MVKVLMAVLMSVLLVGSAHGQQFVYDSGDPALGAGMPVFSEQWLAQSFVAQDDWQMSTLGVFADGTQPVTLALVADNSGLPGLELGRWTIDKTDWEPGGSWGYTNASYQLTSGSHYWVEYISTGSIFDAYYLPLPAPRGNPNIAISTTQGTDWAILPEFGPLGLRIAVQSVGVPEPGTACLSLVCLMCLIQYIRLRAK